MRTWQFPSSSSPKIYVTQLNDNGLLSCDCPGWTVKRLDRARFCKHCKKVAEDERLTLEERDGQMFVVSSGNKPSQSHSPAHTDKPTQPISPRTSPTSLAKPFPTNPQRQGFIAPMLASVMPEGRNADSYGTDWIAEEKFDGHRLIIRIEEEISVPKDPDRVFDFGHVKIPASEMALNIKTVTAWSRLGNVRTLPDHIHNLALDLPVGVYDGELIVPGSQHSYSVTAGQNSGTEALVLFDMLETGGNSIMGLSQRERREFLEIAYSALDMNQQDEGPIRLAHQFPPSIAAVQDIWDDGGEGIIIKKLTGKYNGGWRSPDWVKVKAQLSAVLTIVGFEEGKNGPYSVVKLRDKAGIETTVKTLDALTMRQAAKEPDKFIGKKLVIQYQEKVPSGKYRHPHWDHFAGVDE